MVDPIREEIVEKIDKLVMDAVESDVGNLATVIKLHDGLMEVAEVAAGTVYACLAKIAEVAARLAMQVVLQEAETPEQTLTLVIDTTSTLQCMAREICNGRNPIYIPIPDGLGLQADDIFEKEAIVSAKEPSIPHKVSDIPASPVAVEEKPELVKEPASVSVADAGQVDSATQPAKVVGEVGSAEKKEEPVLASGAVSASGNYPKFDLGSLTPSHLADFLGEMDDLIHKAEGLLLALEKSPHQSKEEIQELLGVFHTVKGVSGIIKLREVIDLAHQAEVVLEEAAFLPGEAVSLLFQAIDVFKSYSQSLRNYHDQQAFLEVPEVASLISRLKVLKLPVEPVAEEVPVPQPVAAKEFWPKETKTEPKGEVEPVAEKAISSSEDIGEKYLKAHYGYEEVKIKVNRLDALVDAIGELVIVQTMLENDPEISRLAQSQTARNVSTMSKICRQLQELSMSMRMVTIQSTFQTMERMVRDLASNQHKQVDVLVTGEHTELDRNIIEAMYNPLVHLVRNAVDHGIETPERRRAAQKSEKGTIHLKAYHHGGNVMIEVQDDGQGLNRDKILELAIQKGLLHSAQHYTDEEVYQMIFLPGFSTSTEVTEISGRGVGLDVVKKSLAKFRGGVEFFTTPGHGTTFRLTLPLTLAIIDGMLVKVSQERYIIPLINIEEFIQVFPEQLGTVAGRGEVLMLRGEVISVFRLHNLLRVKSLDRSKEARVGVIVSWEGKRCCLLVNELFGQQQVVIKSLGSDFNKLVGISGAAILGDGRVGMILDIQNILHLALGSIPGAAG